MRLNGNGTHHNGNGHSNGSAGRVSFAPGAMESALSTKSVSELLDLFEASGDQAPFEEIVRRYAGMVYNVCYQVSRDSHEAEDATQAVFLTLAVRSKTAQKIQYLGPWLQRVAQRLSLDMKRSKKRRAAREVKHHDINVGRWEENNQPHDLGMDELRGILRDEIDRLPAKYRMPLVLHYFGGLKPDEMSKELGIKANTLGVRLHRARKMLGDNLQKKGIVVGGTMLSAALATLVPMYIQHTIASKAIAAAASYSLGHSLVAADVTAQVLGVMHVARHAAILGKIKAVTAAIAIGAAAVAGAGNLVRAIKSSGFEFRNLLDTERWFAPLFDRLRSPLRFSDSSKRLDDALNATSAGDDALLAFAPSIPPTGVLGQLSMDRASDGDDVGLMLASIGELGPTTIQLRRAPVAAPVKPQAAGARPTTMMPIAAAWPHLANQHANRVVAPTIAPAVTTFAQPIRSASSPASIDAQFAAATGTFRLDGGRLDRHSIALDSTRQALRSFHIRDGEVYVKTLTVGESGAANVLQTGGSVGAEKLTLARDAGSVGEYALAGGAINSVEQNIGERGAATFLQTGGANTAQKITLALEKSSVSTYALRDGTLHARELTVGSRGTAIYAQSGGLARIIGAGGGSEDGGGVRIADKSGSRGTVNLSGGTLEADKVFVGLNGDATYTLSGGQTIANKIVLGTADHSTASFVAINGTVTLDGANQLETTNELASNLPRLNYSRSTAGAFTIAASHLQQNAIVVGLNGDAVFQLGNARDTATLTEGDDGSRTPVVIRATASAHGELRGWGDLALRGQLFLNGKLVGDGFGKSRTLDLSSVAGVVNTIENDIDGSYGLYAQRSGQIRLPAIKVARDGNYNWGESPNDPVPDLVNSVRLGFSGLSAPGEAKLTLIAPDDASATTALGAPADELFVGLWKFDRVGLEVDRTKLLVRYDEQMVEHLGLSESSLSIWAYDGAWRELALADTVLNTDQNLIGGELYSRFEYFAVSVSALAGADWMNGGSTFHIPGYVDASAAARSMAFIGDANLISSASSISAGNPDVVPEPATGALLITAAMLLGRRRRA